MAVYWECSVISFGSFKQYYCKFKFIDFTPYKFKALLLRKKNVLKKSLKPNYF